jgi:hypothetical protein
MACFTDLQLTGADGGEGFSRFLFARGDLMVGDRFYAKPPSLQHVLRSGANFLVRVGWNSMRMVTASGARLDLGAIYARMAPGETSEVLVFVTGCNKGQGREPRWLFPARLIIFRRHEEVSARAVRVAERQHSKKRSGMALQPMTLASARFLMVLTSLPPDPAMARSWLLSHLILALLIEDGASEVFDSPPARSAGHVHPVSLWRLHAALRFALLGAVLSSFAVAGLQQAGSSIIRHICDPPWRRTCQAVLARSRAPLAALPSHP